MSDVELDLDSDPDMFFADYYNKAGRESDERRKKDSNDEFSEPVLGPQVARSQRNIDNGPGQPDYDRAATSGT